MKIEEKINHLTKVCAKCNKEKELKEFDKQHDCKFGVNSKCKVCRQIDYQNNKQYILKKRKNYYKENLNKIKEAHKNYRQNNELKIKETNRVYKQNHKKERNKYNKNRNINDINYKLRCNLRRRISSALKNNYKSGSAVKDLGCSIEELKIHIENKFKQGMAWKNYGLYGWHIDHIIPLSSFDLTNREQFLKACHYTNLQPLWAKDNLSKSNKLFI